MKSEIFRQQEKHLVVDLPPKVIDFLTSRGMPREMLSRFRAMPTMRGRIEGISGIELERRQVDAVELLRPFLGNPIFFGALRIMDLLNGCRNQCDTCYIDSVVPSLMFSGESVIRLLKMRQSRAMFAPDHFRFGSSGDVLNHPEGVAIVAAAAAEAEIIPDFKGFKRDEYVESPYRLTVMTNYRRNMEGQILKLLELTQRCSKLHVTISLPFNLSDEINRNFDDFVERHPEYFGSGHKKGRDELVHHIGDQTSERVAINDVRHPYQLGVFGRVIEEEKRLAVVHSSRWIGGDGYGDWQVGLVKLYLNPEGLWLDMYVSTESSHTGRAFFLLDPETAGYMSKLPFHWDFPTPPNWPGGSGQTHEDAISSGNFKEMTVVRA